MMTPLYRWAIAIAVDDLPLAVGPAIQIIGDGWDVLVIALSLDEGQVKKNKLYYDR